METVPETLEVGKTVVGMCEGGDFKYYTVEITDTSHMLIITYDSHSAEPANDSSDPDIYVSNRSEKVNQGTGYSDNYLWKSTNIGSDKLEIHPSDENFTSGTFSVGIYGYKPGLNTFNVRLEMVHAAAMIDLPDRFEHTVDTWDYYKFPVLYPGDSRLEVVVTPSSGHLALFASPFLYYPNEQEHHWSVVADT
jgi:hypothetical protein